MTTRTSTNFWLDVVSLVVMIGLAATGGLIHFVLPAGSGHFYQLFGWNRHDIGQLHFYLAAAAIVLLALHVLLHWIWICCVIAKMAGRGAPSQRLQTACGLTLLLGIALLLGGGLWWASSVVQETAPGGGGRGRRAHLESASLGQAVMEGDCPAGAAIDGRTSVTEAARICGVTAAQLTEQLKLPANTDPGEHLGRLKRRHGLDLQTVRRLACR